MPGFLFTAVIKIDQLEDTKVERLWLRLIGSQKTKHVDNGKFVDSKKLRDVLKSHKPDGRELVSQKKRLDLDYRLGYGRIPCIEMKGLVRLYRNCKIDMVWFTCHADVF
jgi:hypothetical protein